MIAFAGVGASLAPAAPARAQCTAARVVGRTEMLSEAWRAAVDALVRSTAEPAHPWSCGGGTVELALEADGGRLTVARAGAEPVTRRVASPDDVLPLGQALLSMPLTASEPEPVPTKPEPASDPSPHATPAAEVPPAPHSRRLLLSAGVDARGVGSSGVAWIGPTLSAGLVMGRWLPSISIRQQTAFASDGPSIGELSVALAVQSTFALSPIELRTGLALRGAVVERDLPRPLGEQSRIEGRLGAVVGIAIPVFSWANVVMAADADVVVLSRETTAPQTATDTQRPTAFPTYTIGGSASFEVPL